MRGTERLAKENVSNRTHHRNLVSPPRLEACAVSFRALVEVSMKDPRTLCLVSAKIRNLTDFYQRILSNQQPPSGLDIVNTLRYFQQTLLG